MNHSRASRRSGLALIWSLVILSVLTVLMALITWQSVTLVRQTEKRQHQLQADWLARAGIELACARLLTDPKTSVSERLEIIPQAAVRLEVRTEADAPGLFAITCEARYPAGERDVVLRKAARRVRRVVEGDRVRLEVVP